MAIVALLFAVAVATRPALAPPVFVSTIHAITFHVPDRAWFCPLPPDWQGSDHGTVIFLSPPRVCEGTGFPSDARNISDRSLVPSIEFYYGYDPLPPCHAVGAVELLGRMRPLCRESVKGGVSLSVSAIYMADIASLVEITLDTTVARSSQDLAVLRKLAASVQTCRSIWPDGRKKKSYIGVGAACPRNGQYF
jgi:hypothetical protein